MTQSILHKTENREDEDEQPLSISRILKDTFGENFEKASANMRLYLLEAVSASVRLDWAWYQVIDYLGLDEEPEIKGLDFPEIFEDTHEAIRLIEELASSITLDVTFHNLPIGELY